MKKILTLLFIIIILGSLESKAHVKLINPNGGETFISGETILIEWSELATHNTTNWELYYSPDDGFTWITISDSIAYPVRDYAWTIPVEETTQGVIKIIQNNIGTDYNDVSPSFKIENSTGIELNSESSQLYQSMNIYPNPATTQVKFDFSLDKTENISFEFYSIKGHLVDNIKGENFSADSHTINWNTEAVKPGIYFCIIKTPQTAKSYKLSIYK